MPFALKSFTPSVAICCHKFLWIHRKSPSQVLYVAFLPPDDACADLALPSSLPLTFCPCYWVWPWVQTEQSQNWCFACHSKFCSCGVWLGIEVGGGHGLERWGQEQHMCHLAVQKVHMREHKICMCYGILHVIFVLSTLELIKRHLISFMVLEKSGKLLTGVIGKSSGVFRTAFSYIHKLWVVFLVIHLPESTTNTTFWVPFLSSFLEF